MNAAADRWRSSIIQSQEIAFSICMAVVAILSRDNPILVYPQILWMFVGLLGFNLSYHFFLRKPDVRWVVPFVSIAANILLIAGIIRYSGGIASQFWPMYLLPIFTACLYLDGWRIAFAVAACAGFLSYFYIESFWHGLFWNKLELAVKLAVLILSGGMMSLVSFRERQARESLEKSRAELDRLTQSLNEAQTSASADPKEMSQWLDGLLHSINNGLMVISGTTELLLTENPPGESSIRWDLLRIQQASKSLASMTSSLLSWSSKDIPALQTVTFETLLPPVLTLLDYKIKQKGLICSLEAARNLPAVRANLVALQQTMTAFLQLWVDLTQPGTTLNIRASGAPNGFEIGFSSRNGGGTADFETIKKHFRDQRGTLNVAIQDGSIAAVVTLTD